MEGGLTEDNVNARVHSVLIGDNDSDTLLVAFGGIMNGLAVPVFEFMRSLDELTVNKVFVRDFQQCWYSAGLRDVTTGHGGTTEYLRDLVARHGARRTVFLGNSAGAYAALLYGVVLGVDEVLAFSPQTFIDRRNRRRHWDRRWRAEVRRLDPASSYYFDLRRVLHDHAGQPTTCHVFWDDRHRLDRVHARRITGDPRVIADARRGGGHGVIKDLRDRGELAAILRQSVGSPAS